MDNPLFNRVRRRLTGAKERPGTRPEGSAQPSGPPGPKPEVSLEQTNFGPMVDALIARVRRNQRRLGVNPDYDLVREHFDHYYYMFQATELQEDPTIDPIRVFLRAGARAKHSPDADFSMEKYLRRYPEKADGPERSPYLEWIKRGKAVGEIADPADGIDALAPVLGLSEHEIVEEAVRLRADMMQRLRTGTLGEMYAKAIEIEPLIGAAMARTVANTKQLPLRNDAVAGAVAGIHACHQEADFRRARLVIATNKPRWGGGRRIEGHIAHALAGRISPDDIVVVYTDESGVAPPGRFPDGVREVDFAAHFADVPFDLQQQALVSLLRSFRADAILNVNSRVLYLGMKPFGRALASSERVFLCMFCDEQQAMGNWEGRGLRWFYPAFDYVAGLVTDSEHQRQELIQRYQVPEEDAARLHVFRAPAEPDLPVAPAPPVDPERRPVIFWAGRFDRQKRPDIALEVARRMPEVDFRLWGEKVLKGDPLGTLPRNVSLEGLYDRFTDLDLSQADAWLYTSAWDGVPSLLMEVAMTGVPIVATLVGGVGEVLSEEDSWPVADRDEPESYEKALREILADPENARRRALLLRERLVRERRQEAYAEYAATVLLSDERAASGEQSQEGAR